MKSLLLLYVVASAVSALAHPQLRGWTDDQGRKTKATLLRVDGDEVLLKLENGREALFPIERLSQADQDFVLDHGNGSEPRKHQDLNFDSPWPDRVKFDGDPEIEVMEEDADRSSFIYESANYRYLCDVRLSKSVTRGFARLFEATHQFTRALPLAVDGGRNAGGKYLIRLFESEKDYFKAGGPPGSAGVYMGQDNVVMVPLTSLGVRKVGSGYMLDRSRSLNTLPHELVHQLTPGFYYQNGAMGWFTEGIAEYVAVTPYRSGAFNVRTNLRPILEYVTAYGEKNTGGRALGDTIKVGPLKEFMLQSYSSFLSKPMVNYGSALLITHYFFHLDGEGDASRMKRFLKSLRAGKRGEAALKELLDSRSWGDLENDIQKAYSRRGVDLIFSS